MTLHCPGYANHAAASWRLSAASEKKTPTAPGRRPEHPRARNAEAHVQTQQRRPRHHLKQSVKIARHPWIAARLAALEKEKFLFGPLNPKAETGVARSIRQLSIRITDVCNLRCHTCGQWGDQGFLHGKNLKDLKKSEVGKERYLALLDDLAAHGHRPSVYLWGGEPTLYNGWLEIIERATNAHPPPRHELHGVKGVDRLVPRPFPAADLHRRTAPRPDNAPSLAGGATTSSPSRTPCRRERAKNPGRTSPCGRPDHHPANGTFLNIYEPT